MAGTDTPELQEASPPAPSAPGWIHVGPELASRHPLYGLGGWLWIPGIYWVLKLLTYILNGTSASNWLLNLPPPVFPADPMFFWVDFFGPCLILTVVLLLWWCKYPYFRWVFLSLTVAGFFLGDHAGQILLEHLRAQGMQFTPAGYGIRVDWTVVVVALLGFSRRYRVTFRHEVRADDPLLTGGSTGAAREGTVQA